jgi:SAM-dependent methyltransferase
MTSCLLEQRTRSSSREITLTTDNTSSGMAALQEGAHGEGHDYDAASPHLSHAELRVQIIDTIRSLVAEQFTRTGQCRVLEIGAGHGGFTDHLAAMGAQVTVTEMSRPSLDLLRDRFAHNPNVRTLHDDGDAIDSLEESYDLVLCISVLHHIPDYVSHVEELVTLLEPGGTFASFQDPLWYPRRGKMNLALDRGAYLAWRLFRGDFRRGIATRARRIRGIYDESNPSDMVEYHVVRQGVDDEALRTVLKSRFEEVREWRYWSTQSHFLQRAGAKTGLETTFALVAKGNIASP